MFAVTVIFHVKPGALAAFLPLIHENAEASATQEPGCRQFDVCTDPGRPDEVFLYELYDSPAAFQAHKETPHYHTFDHASADLVAEKSVRIYAQVGR